MNTKNLERVKYIDNLRWIIIVLVVIFHVVDIFTCTGAKIHYNYRGIPAFDVICYSVYPWFMGCMFVVAGMSARLSLAKRTDREFAKARVHKLLVPFIAYMLVFSPLTSAFCFSASGGWNDFGKVPAFVMYLIMLCIGMGHTWFIIELFAISMLFLLIKKLDRNNKLDLLGSRCGIIALLLMFIPLFGASQVLNFLGVFRNLLFLLLFLLGYYVLGQDKAKAALAKYRIPLLVSSLILCVIQMYVYWGKNFSEIVNEPLVMLYTWAAILTVFAYAPAVLDFSNAFTAYMSQRSFGIYLFHYLPMILIAFVLTRYTHIPVLLDYPLVLILSGVATLVIVELFARIPFLNYIFTQIKKKD